MLFFAHILTHSEFQSIISRHRNPDFGHGIRISVSRYYREVNFPSVSYLVRPPIPNLIFPKNSFLSIWSEKTLHIIFSHCEIQSDFFLPHLRCVFLGKWLIRPLSPHNPISRRWWWFSTKRKLKTDDFDEEKTEKEDFLLSIVVQFEPNGPKYGSWTLNI